MARASSINLHTLSGVSGSAFGWTPGPDNAEHLLFGCELGDRTKLALCSDGSHLVGDLHVIRIAAELLCRECANRALQVLRGIQDGRPAHDRRAGAARAETHFDERSGAMKNAGDPVDAHLERVGRDLGEHRLQALPDAGRPDVHLHIPVRAQHQARVFGGSRGAALEVAPHAQATRSIGRVWAIGWGPSAASSPRVPRTRSAMLEFVQEC